MSDSPPPCHYLPTTMTIMTTRTCLLSGACCQSHALKTHTSEFRNSYTFAKDERQLIQGRATLSAFALVNSNVVATPSTGTVTCFAKCTSLGLNTALRWVSPNLRPNPHWTRSTNIYKQMEPAIYWTGEFTLDTSNIEGIARKFACLRPVWIGALECIWENWFLWNWPWIRWWCLRWRGRVGAQGMWASRQQSTPSAWGSGRRARTPAPRSYEPACSPPNSSSSSTHLKRTRKLYSDQW